MKEQLKLADQMCFPIYLLAKEIVNQYRPILDKLELTYPQYLVMIVLWEQGKQTVSELGEKLNLDSGTLTPLLKRLEQKKFISRKRKSTDERVVEISTTALGDNLHKKAVQVPQQLADSICISIDDFQNLKINIENILTNINNNINK
ncbi:MAG: MarR family transcriptional regulator [Lutibacter sp.]|nr:MarR family transcriptional regulator [Lutibacter sp.]